MLHVRGARQRAEVYLNQKLVGYSIMEELPFECDLSAAAVPGRNRLAIRITNPGGRLDWVDGRFTLNWGGMTFQKSHGFGGLDRAIMLSAHDAVRIRDVWALNTPRPATIAAHVELENRAGAVQRGTLRFTVIDPVSGHVLATVDKQLELASGQSTLEPSPITAPGALTWDLDSPKLYRLQASWHAEPAAPSSETRSVDVGFRWFQVDGLGKDALFRLNGRRIRLYTSISWGYWGLNGLFPIPELAEKEVRVAKSLNLNTLNFHRNLAKEDVLYVQDRLGLLRCLEPGGGSQAAAPLNGKPAELSAARYMHAKIQGMIRAFRSHPSVIHYILQNEGVLDPTNPNLDAIFEMMRREDPSRSIVGTDGFVLRSRQAWVEAYGTEVHKSLKPATVDGGAAGWWVDHTGHFSDIWQDGLYTSPTDFYFYTKIAGEITEWGEMKGASAIDNHAGLLRQIASHGGKSYDLLDHREILQAYEHFLDRWKFRTAFPTCEQLFLSIGRRAYETWGQFMENVRICDNVDMAAISGWESTAIENHSGLLDNFRDFKADPKVIAESLLPVRPLAKQHQLVLALGEKATFDLFLLNDSCKPVDGRLNFTSTDPATVSRRLAEFAAPALQKDRFSYLLQQGFVTDTRLRARSLKQSGKARRCWRVPPAKDRLSASPSNLPRLGRSSSTAWSAPRERPGWVPGTLFGNIRSTTGCRSTRP